MKRLAALLLLCAVTAPLRAATSSPRVYMDRVEAHWFGDNDRFWYRRDLPDGRREFVVVDAVRAVREPAFDHERLAAALSRRTATLVDPERLPVERIELEAESLRVFVGRRAWRCDLGSYELTVEPRVEENREQPERRRSLRRRDHGRNTVSPDGRWEAAVRGHNLVLKDLREGGERVLTHDANPDSSYARSAERDRSVGLNYGAADSEEPVPEVYWSPDSRRLVAMRTRPGTRRVVHVIESAPEDQLQPKLHSYPYLKPGDEIPISRPRLFDAEKGIEIPLSEELAPNPWAISEVRWLPDSSEFTYVYNQRGHQVLRIVGVDAETGATRAVLDERSETFICYSQKYFCHPIDETGEIIWMSERDGWNHLYLHDARTGSVRNQITRGEWVVRAVDHVDEEARQIWFRAGGIVPGQDPYYIHYCRVNLDGTGLVVLTEGDGTHSAEFSPDRRFLIDTWSRVDLPPITELRRASDGSLVMRLEEADAGEVFATGWRAPERFHAKGRDGETDIHGIIHRPKDHDPSRLYPVIEYIYAGPHGSFVPKAFQRSYRWESLLDRGFIVVQIDGMGTSNRSKKFHDVCWKNLGDSGFPDRILWMKAAARKDPSMDLSRVGIYGGSAGGQSALRALLAHGDFYKAAAADCGCHDNRMDKIWWNEQWMGWPVAEHYHEQSNVTQAHRLQGKLLLTVGELDRNVDPASTMQVVAALIRADKDFDLIVFPGAGHGAGGSRYGERRRDDFFARHLLGPHQRETSSPGELEISGR